MSTSARRPGPDRPSDARLYDVMLGGGNNFQSDRTLADEVLRDAPGVRAAAFAKHMAGIGSPFQARRHADVLALFDGFDVAPQGLVLASNWPDRVDGPGSEAVYAGLGRRC